ncbi:DUF397 domain-containing protein [Streptomyces sp. NRRL F-5135]|uniref:DUF397 domain-containing protein n=1 Tax=Streptomyces sp. NRRL F-5135 TaxID=1463858 RepID=UPI0004CC0AD9|nr:DUF397 domain-containing protein [Streptomyces sp. NRRL F-5135]
MSFEAELCWVKSSFSGDGGNNCLEVALSGTGRVALRDSTRPDRTVTTPSTAFRALVRGLKSEAFARPSA